MFCFTCIAGKLWPAVVVAVAKRRVDPLQSLVRPSSTWGIGGVRGVSTAAPKLLATAVQVQASKKRVQRRKPVQAEDTGQQQGFWCVSAFTTAEEFRMDELQLALSKTKLYEPTCLYSGSDDSAESTPDVIHAMSKFHVTNEPRHLYIFREGSVVCWNVTDFEVNSLINFLFEFGIAPYDDNIIMGEREVMYYTYTNEKKAQFKKEICI